VTNTHEYDGHTFEIDTLSDDSVSVVCTDPLIVGDTDETPWPSDEIVSGWFGYPVRFFDRGDSPDGVEGIFRRV